MLGMQPTTNTLLAVEWMNGVAFLIRIESVPARGRSAVAFKYA